MLSKNGTDKDGHILEFNDLDDNLKNDLFKDTIEEYFCASLPEMNDTSGLKFAGSYFDPIQKGYIVIFGAGFWEVVQEIKEMNIMVDNEPIGEFHTVSFRGLRIDLEQDLNSEPLAHKKLQKTLFEVV